MGAKLSVGKKVVNVLKSSVRQPKWAAVLLVPLLAVFIFAVNASKDNAAALPAGATWGVEPGAAIPVVNDIGSGQTEIIFRSYVDKNNSKTVIPHDLKIAIKRFFYVVTPDGSGNPRDRYEHRNRASNSFFNPDYYANGLISAPEGDVGEGQQDGRNMYEIGNSDEDFKFCVHPRSGSTGGCSPDASIREDRFVVRSNSTHLAPGNRICTQVLMTLHNNGWYDPNVDVYGWYLFDSNDPVRLSEDNNYWTLSESVCYTIPPTTPPLYRLTCSVSSVSLGLNAPGRVSVTLTNPNASAAVGITSSRWDAPSSAPTWGRGVRDSNGNLLDANGGNTAVPAGGSLTIYSADDAVRINVSGTHSLSWTVAASNAALSPNGCSSTSAITASAYPYVRFYGNDVIAGGGYGDAACIPKNDAVIQASGIFTGGGSTTGQYRGSASELAVFAGGQISGLIAGSQADRSPEALVFSNTSSSMFSTTANPLLGGGFDAFAACTPPHGLTPTQPPGDLFTGGQTINPGDRITHVINGDVYINANITYGTVPDWTLDSIPLFRIYATGNIYISGNVTQLDGFYAAQGNIYTCADGSSRYAANDRRIHCGSKLTFNGAVRAQRMYLDRVTGTIGQSTGTSETAASSAAAEVFNFSPEMYLALYDDAQTNSASTRFDSILSLPPAL